MVTALIMTGLLLMPPQDTFREDRIKGLALMRDVAFVIRVNGISLDSRKKSLSDALEFDIRRDLPALSIKDASDSNNWIELNVIDAGPAVLVEVAVHRPVYLVFGGTAAHSLMAKVWSDQILLYGGSTTTDDRTKEQIETLARKLALDYLRGNPTKE